MLNGVAPIIIFTFPLSNPVPNLTGIPTLDSLLGTIGIPIPVYLDEKLTGMYVSSQEKHLDIDTQPELSSDGTQKVTQRAVNNTVTVNFIASKDSLVLAVLLAFADEAFKRATNAKYSVTYFNGTTFVLGGKIQSLQSQDGENDTLTRITMVIHKEVQSTITKSSLTPISGSAGTAAGVT